MITAWSPPGAPRARSSAVSRRLMLVTMLLFGLVFAHGISAEGASGHVVRADIAASETAGAHGSGAEPGTAVHGTHAGSAEDTEGHQDEHGSSHPALECLPGQPQQGPAMEAPSVCTWHGGAAVSDQWRDGSVRSEGASAPPQLRDSTGAGVLRI